MPDIKGVDVASWQGLPGEWTNDPGAKGIQWAAVKFSEVSAQYGVYENPDAVHDWNWLWEHKLGRLAYLFAHPAASIADTVAAFRSMTERYGFLPADGVMVDLEVSDGRSPAEVSSWARELCAELASLYNRKPVVYTYHDFATEGYCEGLGEYPLFIASITPAGLPVVPPPWSNWFAQQYSQAGSIDQDVAHFSTLEAMQAAMGAPQTETVQAVHVTTGEESLVALSHLLKTPISVMLTLTLKASADQQFVPPLADYIDYGNFQSLMPKGVSVRYLETVRT